MSEEKKTAATEDVKEARKLSMEELEKVSGGQTEELVILAQYAETAKEYAVTMKKVQSTVTTKTFKDNIEKAFCIVDAVSGAEIEAEP